MTTTPLTSLAAATAGEPQPLAPALPYEASSGTGIEPFSPGVAGKQAEFAEVLGRQFAPTAEAKPTAEQTARNSAEQLVSLAFVQPLLKQLRETSMAAPPFAPTSGEKQMRSIEDAEVARRIVHAARFPIVDRIAKELIQRAKDARGRSIRDEISATAQPTRIAAPAKTTARTDR